MFRFKEILKNKTETAWWIAAAAILGLSFIVFYYTDFSDTLDNSVMLAKCILDGRFKDFYAYAAKNASPKTIYSANYNVYLYFVFLIWNLPTVIAHILTGFDYMQSAMALLWCKLLILGADLGGAFVIKKIVGLYREDKRLQRFAALLFLAGSCVIVPSMVAVQYDNIALLLMLLGIYCYIKGYNKRFMLFFALAMPLKIFALFLFVPLVILKEKSVIKIILKTACIMVFQALFALPFFGDPYYKLCVGTQNRDALNIILGGGGKNCQL